MCVLCDAGVPTRKVYSMKVNKEDGSTAILQLPEVTHNRIMKVAASLPSPTPFTNEHGQVIYPGDHVVAITTGYSKSINQQLGRYVGQRTRNAKRRGYGDAISTVIEYVEDVIYWVDDTGKEYTSWWDRPKDVVEKTRKVVRRRSLKRNRLIKIEFSVMLDLDFGLAAASK